MFSRTDYDLIVIGSGAGGSVGASYARTLGKRVALVEKDAVLGGECPNWACIPTKALLQAAEVYQTASRAKDYGIITGKVGINPAQIKKWRDLVVSRTGSTEDEKLLAEEGIELIRGAAKFVSPTAIEVNGKTYRAKRFLVATGSDTFIPDVPGLKSNYITFKEAAMLERLPKSIIIVGGGPIGCEFAQLFSDFGVKVTLLESAKTLLGRDEPEVGKLVAGLFKERGVEVLTSVKLKKVEKRSGQKVLSYQVGRKSGRAVAEQILVATGKIPNLSFDPEAAGIQVQNRHIITNGYLKTTNPRVFIAGDNAGPLQFTHTAAYQSRLAVHNAFNRRKVKPSYTSVPRCVFVRPEVASVGFTETEAKKRRIRTKVGFTPIGVLGRANTSNEFDGFVKVVTDRRGFIIGASIVAPRAGEMIHELALAIKLKANAYEVSQLVHAFPTYSEAIKIACANVQ